MTLFKGPDQIELYYFGRGHTNGDAWVLFPALRVVRRATSSPARTFRCSMRTTAAAASRSATRSRRRTARSAKLADTVVTGHSTNMTLPELMEYATFNREFADAVRAAKKAGRASSDIAKSWTMPAKYQGYAPAAGGAAALERAGHLRRT